MREHRKRQQASLYAKAAKDNADHGDGTLFAMQPELSTGAVPAKGPECGNQDEKRGIALTGCNSLMHIKIYNCGLFVEVSWRFHGGFMEVSSKYIRRP